MPLLPRLPALAALLVGGDFYPQREPRRRRRAATSSRIHGRPRRRPCWPPARARASVVEGDARLRSRLAGAARALAVTTASHPPPRRSTSAQTRPPSPWPRQIRASLDGALDAPLASRAFDLAVGATALCCRNGRRSTPLHACGHLRRRRRGGAATRPRRVAAPEGRQGRQPLHRALWFGHEAVDKRSSSSATRVPGAALHGLSLHEANHALERPLYISALRGHPRCVDLLLQQQGGGSILEDVEYCDGYSPLHAAMHHQKSRSSTRSPLASRPTAQTSTARTPLHLAASGGPPRPPARRRRAAPPRRRRRDARRRARADAGARREGARPRRAPSRTLKTAAPAAAEGDGGKKPRRRRGGMPVATTAPSTRGEARRHAFSHGGSRPPSPRALCAPHLTPSRARLRRRRLARSSAASAMDARSLAEAPPPSRWEAAARSRARPPPSSGRLSMSGAEREGADAAAAAARSTAVREVHRPPPPPRSARAPRRRSGPAPTCADRAHRRRGGGRRPRARRRSALPTIYTLLYSTKNRHRIIQVPSRRSGGRHREPLGATVGPWQFEKSSVGLRGGGGAAAARGWRARARRDDTLPRRTRRGGGVDGDVPPRRDGAGRARGRRRGSPSRPHRATRCSAAPPRAAPRRKSPPLSASAAHQNAASGRRRRRIRRVHAGGDGRRAASARSSARRRRRRRRHASSERSVRRKPRAQAARDALLLGVVLVGQAGSWRRNRTGCRRRG